VSVTSGFGQVLADARRQAGLSLVQLAEASGISKSTLHAMEQGRGNPTLTTLWALATALQVPLGSLLPSEPQQPEVIRAGEGPTAEGVAVRARLLRRLMSFSSVEMYDVAIGSATQLSKAHGPGVFECLLVTTGAVRVGPVDAPVELTAGDTAFFEADVEHCYRGLRKQNRGVLLMAYR
jgi:transcriptional regulator with XRE-family HTH domain